MRPIELTRLSAGVPAENSVLVVTVEVAAIRDYAARQ
jgi:hypothetical protein